MRRLVYVLVVAGVFIAGLAIGSWANDWLNVDRCLDGGGAWDYDLENCRYA